MSHVAKYLNSHAERAGEDKLVNNGYIIIASLLPALKLNEGYPFVVIEPLRIADVVVIAVAGFVVTDTFCIVGHILSFHSHVLSSRGIAEPSEQSRSSLVQATGEVFVGQLGVVNITELLSATHI